MANDTFTDLKTLVYEGTVGHPLTFRTRHPITKAVVTPDSVKVFVKTEEGTTVNDRDGTTNTVGLSITDTNLVTFVTEAADNTIIETSSPTLEYRYVTIEVTYNTTYKHFERFRYKLGEI